MKTIDAMDRSPALWVGRASIAIASIATMIWYRRFAITNMGPIYPLELLFLAWACCAFFTFSRHSLETFCRLSYPTLLFTGWGMLLIYGDLVTWRYSGNHIQLSRIAQHAIIAAYPFMWTLVGYWCLITGRFFTRFLIVILIVCNTLYNFYGLNVVNIAVGPLITLPFLMLLHRQRWDSHHRLLSLAQWFLIGALAYLAFIPFWRMWLIDMQRTSLLILFNTLIAVPWILKSKTESYWRCLRTIVLSIGIFISGLALVTFMARNSRKPVVQETIPQIPVLPGMPIYPVLKKEIVAPTPIASQINVGNSKSFPLAQPTPNPTPAPQKKKENVEGSIIPHVFHSLYHPDDYLQSTGSRLPLMLTRRYMWGSSLLQWHTHPLQGVGFIPEVPEEVFPGLKNTGGFETGSARPVSGPHNSYLSVLVRMGLIGFALFFWMIYQFAHQAYVIQQTEAPLDLFDLSIFMIPVNGFIHALFNVGFESPPRALLMWLFLGMLVARYSSYGSE